MTPVGWTRVRTVHRHCHCERSQAISIPLRTAMEIARMRPGLALGPFAPRYDTATDIGCSPDCAGVTIAIRVVIV